uniref:Uncharacterized protein n=1 Tax=Arundo donax TaxID=35708 RepID=A0A0A8YDH7_ARUDO
MAQIVNLAIFDTKVQNRRLGHVYCSSFVDPI